MTKPSPFAAAPEEDIGALRRRVAELESQVEDLKRRASGIGSASNSFAYGTELIEAIDDGVAAFDADWRFVYLNRNGERLLGRSAEDLLGKIFWDEFPLLIGTESEKIYRQVMAQRVPGQSEEYYAPLEGWFEGRYFPSSDGGMFVLFRNISTRKLREKEIRANEQRLLLAQEAARLGAWSLDLRDPGQNYWSPEAYAIAGFDSSWRPTYEGWLAHMHPDDRSRVDAEIQQALETGEGFAATYRFVGPDGIERWHEARGRVRKDGSGAPVGADGITLDITDRKKSEHALRDSEMFNRSIVESSRDCIKVLDVDGRLLSVNTAGQTLLGVEDIGELLNRPWFELWEGSARESCLEALAAARNGGVGSFEAPFTTEVGRTFWFHVVVSPILDSSGHVHQLLAVSRDITTVKKTEAELKASEERWRSLANAMPQFVWIAQQYGNTEFINHYWYEYTGLPSGELSMASWAPVIHPDDVAGIAEMWQEATRSGAERTFEYRVKRASDGAWRWHLGFHRPIRNSDGSVSRWVGVGFDIHDRKLAEEGLRATEERQRLAVEAGNVGLWDWNIADNQIHWSERVYEFHGVTPETFQGRLEDFQRLIHPDDFARVRGAIQRSVETGELYDVEFRVVRPDGATRWLATSARVLRDSSGRSVRMLGATLDITDQKSAQQQIHTANETLSAFIDHAPDGIFVADSAGNLTDANPAGCALLGLPRQEVLTRTIRDFIRPEDLDRLQNVRESVLAGNTETSEWELRSSGGEWIPVELSAKLLPDGRWQAFARDVRERRRLQASALHLAAIVQSSDDAIISKDLNGIITSWNRGAERLFGYTASEAIGRPVSILAAPDRTDEVPAILERIRRGEQISNYETVRLTKDGRALLVSLTVSPVRDPSGRIIGASKISRDITERKRAEEALARSEQRLRVVLDNAPAMISYIGNDYRYARVNRAYEEWFGLPADDIRGRHIRDAFGAEYFDSVLPLLERVRAGESVSFDAVVRRPNGEAHDMAVVYTPDRESHGRVNGFIALLQDVTERKRSEKTLREREEEQRRLLAAIPDVICRFDRDLRFVYANPAIERVTGAPPSHFVGKTHLEAGLDEQLSEALRNSLRRIFETGEPDTIEFDFTSPVMGLRHLLGLGIPEVSARGEVETVLSIVRDITDRKRAEAERATSLVREQDARQTAELLNRVGPMLAAELDLERLVQSVTDIATELVGAEFGSFFHNVTNEKGESYMLYTLSGVQREAFARFPMPRNTDVFAPTFRGEGVVRSGNITRDPRYGRSAPHYGMPRGHLPVRSYLAVPVQSRSGEVLGGLFFGHYQEDRFTDRHEALVLGIAAQAAIAMDNARLFEQAQRIQSELKRSNDELTRANQDLETFAYSASHDLQEPLRMISISAQLLQRRAGKLSEESVGFLNGVLEGSRRMQTLIQDLLSYTRATRHAEGDAKIVDPNEVLERVLQNLKPLFDECGARVSMTDIPAVAVHEVHLTQLFQNLIGNALKYRSAEDPYVQVSATQRDGWITIALSDNGIGIDPKYGDQIFGLFKRLHTREEYPGSGIGLAICQRLVQQYGGRIWLDSSVPGKGSTFAFTVPAATIH